MSVLLKIRQDLQDDQDGIIFLIFALKRVRWG